jgi:hypothetical protein
MITRDRIETAYSFLHQKRNIYIHSTLDWQKDDIELAIGSYVDDMSLELYEAISDGRADFLRDHKRFTEDITQAVERLENML